MLCYGNSQETKENEFRWNDVVFNVNRTGDFVCMGHFKARVLDIKNLNEGKA